MEEINISDIVKNEYKISPEIQGMMDSIRSQNPIDSNKTSEPLGYDFGQDLLFGQGLDEVQQKPSLSFQNTNVEDAFTNIGGDWLAKYPTYKRGRDNAEYAAQNQSTGEKWANGINKALLKTGNAIIGGTAGIVYGVGAAIGDGSLSALYDNDFSNTLNDWDAKLNYQLPNYYSKQEQEKGLFGQAGTANFWADKVLGGLSFTAGAIVSEGIWAWATGGASLATAAARWGTKALNFTKAARWSTEALGEAGALSALAKNKSFLKQAINTSFEAGTISKQAAINLGKAADFANTSRFMLTSAGFESSVEALQYKKEAEERFYNSFADVNGREPNEQDIAEFNKNLESSANAVFGFNMAIVGSSNLVTMGKLFELKNPINTGIGDFIEKKAFGYGVTKGTDGVYKTLTATRGQKIARNIFAYGKAPVTEGLYEEGFQGITNKTANKWIDHTYNDRYTTENFDTVGGLYNSFAEQYGTKEGWVENGVGMIIGAIGGTVNTRAEMKSKEQEQKLKESGLNTFTTPTLQQALLPKKVQLANQIAGFSEEAKTEAQNGNIVRTQLANQGVIHAFLNHKNALGESFDDAAKEIKIALDNITEDQFKEAGIPKEEIDTYKAETLQNFVEKAKQFKQNRTYAEYMVGRNRTVGEKEIGSILGDSFKGVNTNEALIQSLTWVMTEGESANKYMQDIQGQIANELGTEKSNVINTISKLKRLKSNKQGQVTKVVNQQKALTTERDALTKTIAKLNNAPKETDGDKVRGKALEQANIRLLELTDKISELDTQLNTYADELNKSEAYGQGISGLDYSQDISGSTISATDLLSLNDNIENFQSLIASLEESNPQRAQYLNDLLDEYTQAEDIFLTNQKTAIMLSNGDLKLEKINTWIGKKLTGGKSMDEATRDWLTEVLNKYEANILENVGAEQQVEAVVAPEAADNKEIKPKTQEQITKEKVDALEKERVQKLREVNAPTQKGNSLTKATSLKVGDKIKYNGKVYTIKDINQGIGDRVQSFETEEGREINNPYYSGVGKSSEGWLVEKDETLSLQNLQDFNKLTEEQRNKLKEDVKKQIEALPDNQAYFIHLTPIETDARSIISNGLRTGVAIESTTNTVSSKEALYEAISSIIDGKINHRGSTNLVIIGFDKSVFGSNKINSDNLFDYLIENHPDFAGNFTIPAEYNVGLFTNGRLEVVGREAAQQEDNIQEQKDRINREYDKKISDIKNGEEGLTDLQKYKQRIENMLKKGYNNLSYLGENYDGVANKKPTEEEINRYRELKKEKQFNSPEYRTLLKKLQGWKLLDSAVDVDNNSIAELIDLIDQLEQTVEQEDTQVEITQEETVLISDEIGSSSDLVDYDLAQNVRGAVKVKKVANTNNLRFSHLKIQTILNRLSKDFTVTLKGKPLDTVDYDNLAPGTTFTIENTDFIIGNGGTIEVDASKFQSLQQALSIFLVNTNNTNWSYFDTYTFNGEDFIKLESDFEEDIDPQAIYDLNEDDELSFEIKEDGWNQQLLDKYNKAKTEKAKAEALKNLKNQLKIFVVDSQGRRISTLKSMRDGVTNPIFLQLREVAAQRYLDSPNKTDFKLGIKTKVKNVYLGSPELNMVEGIVNSIPFTDEAISQVEATGYMEGDRVETSKNFTSPIDTTFIAKIAKNNGGKKVPFVVINKGVHKIAYPVSLIAKEELGTKGLIEGILSKNISPQQQIQEINSNIQKFGVKTPKLVYADINDQDKIQATIDAFNNKETYVSMEEFASNKYKKENLSNNATININLENLDRAISDAKVRLNLNELIYTTDREVKIASQIELENELGEVAEEVYNDFVTNSSTKYVDSKGEPLENTIFSDVFDDEPIVKTKSNIQKIKNIKTLEKAFQGKLPKVVIEALGQEKVNRIKELLAMYNFVKSQIVVAPTTITSGTKNSNCK